MRIWDDDGHNTREGDHRRPTDGHFAAPSPTNAVCWVSVPTHAGGWYDNQHKSILTMWEAQRLPEAFRENLHEFDLVMVPSYQNLELFSRYHDNVQLILLGVDPVVWHLEPLPENHTTFDFLVSGRGGRKGVDLAYNAFRTVFGHWWTYDERGPVYKGPSDRLCPRLVMKSMKGHGQYYGPGTTQVTGKISDEAEVALYASCHAYVQPSRGEGFGLQPLQALAMGRPTILTDAHGHESYAKLGVPISAQPSKADYFIHGDAGDWWEPDFDELCEAMWDVYENYETHASFARDSAAIIARDWTWANTTDRFMELLGSEMDKPYSGQGIWTEPEPRLFKIIVNEDHTSNAAGITRHFKKGETYYDIADIKRILFDAGRLSPECLEEDDPGLAPEQIPHIKAYQAQYSACPSCGQVLGSGVMYADVLYDEMESQASSA